MRLIHNHPNVAWRNCQVCRQYQHDESTGEISKDREGNKCLRTYFTPVPCESETTKCPKGHWSKPVLSNQHMLTYMHYVECQAVGEFPDDAIVRRNAKLIALAEKGMKRAEDKHNWEILASLVTKGVVSG